MKVIQPSFWLSAPGIDELDREHGIKMLQFIEKQARISHRSEDRQTEDSWQRFIKAIVIDHGDWSVVEHASITATLRVDRGVTHELVRHRLFSFTQESTRFVKYSIMGPYNMEFVLPERIRETPSYYEIWEAGMGNAELAYTQLLQSGARPQEARSVLPNALAATIAVTGNLRNWRHLLLMRTSKETHPDFRAVAIALLEEFKRVIPILYDDIEPNQRQIDNLKKAR